MIKRDVIQKEYKFYSDKQRAIIVLELLLDIRELLEDIKEGRRE